MKTTVLTSICAFFIALSGLQAQSFVPDQVIIKFTASSSQTDRANFISSIGATLLEDTDNSAAIGEEVLLDVSFPITVNGITVYTEVDLISNIANPDPEVDTGSLNYHLSVSPMSFGQFVSGSGMSDYSPISASCEASYPGGALEPDTPISTTNDVKVKVAILDTGLDPSYPTINQYVVGEYNVLQDDDGVSVDEEGKQLPYNPNAPIAADGNGHGTEITGIIAGLSERAGIDPSNLEILIIKCFEDDGSGYLFNMIQALKAAKGSYADILNISWSYQIENTDTDHNILENRVKELCNEIGAIVVAGAGNDSYSLNQVNLGPASYENIPNLITVGGVVGQDDNCDGSLASFSNYGSSVDICAPAASLSVPSLDGYWKSGVSGTSYATAIVSAAALQSLIYYKDLLIIEDINEENLPEGAHLICNVLIDNATEVAELNNYNISGVVNFKAIKSVEFPAPPEIPFEKTKLVSSQNTSLAQSTTSESSKYTTTQTYPTPFHSFLNIQLDARAEGKAQLELINMQGQVVMQQSVNVVAGSIELQNLAHLSKGSYILNIQQNDQTYKQLVIKN